MRVLVQDRVRMVVLAAMVAGGLLMVVGRRWGWPGPLRLAVTVAVMALVVAVLARWARSAPDARNHVK